MQISSALGDSCFRIHTCARRRFHRFEERTEAVTLRIRGGRARRWKRCKMKQKRKGGKKERNADRIPNGWAINQPRYRSEKRPSHSSVNWIEISDLARLDRTGRGTHQLHDYQFSTFRLPITGHSAIWMCLPTADAARCTSRASWSW